MLNKMCSVVIYTISDIYYLIDIMHTKMIVNKCFGRTKWHELTIHKTITFVIADVVFLCLSLSKQCDSYEYCITNQHVDLEISFPIFRSSMEAMWPSLSCILYQGLRIMEKLWLVGPKTRNWLTPPLKTIGDWQCIVSLMIFYKRQEFRSQ